MDPVVKPSFIPKTPLSSLQEESKVKKSSGVFVTIILVLFLGTGVSFWYVSREKTQLEDQKQQALERIEKAQNQIGTDFVSDMVSLQKRIRSAQLIIQNHVVISPILREVSRTTVSRVQYKSFSYTKESDALTGNSLLSISMEGVAPDYKTIALQTEAFRSSGLIRDPAITTLTTTESGNVEFELIFNVLPSDVTYKSLLLSQNPVSVTQGVQ